MRSIWGLNRRLMTHPPMLRWRWCLRSGIHLSVFYLDISPISLSWNLGNFNGVPGIKSGGNFYNKHCFIYFLHSVVADPQHTNADPDHSFHFNTDPDQTFSNSVQIRIRILLHIIIMRVCDYGSKDPPFYSSTPPLCASTALHGSIVNHLKLLKFETGFSWSIWKFQLEKLKIFNQ